MIHAQPVAGNVYDKYRSRNPIVRLLMAGFFKAMDELYGKAAPGVTLDIGCGEGYLTDRYFRTGTRKESTILGADLSLEMVKTARKEFPSIFFMTASAYDLPFPDNCFDLVIASELLEHVDDPHRALSEMQRLSCELVLLSVPREPIWRALNLCRFKYIQNFGNTPGHLQHWSKKGFLSLLSGYFEILDIRLPFPWTMVLCGKKNSREGSIEDR